MSDVSKTKKACYSVKEAAILWAESEEDYNNYDYYEDLIIEALKSGQIEARNIETSPPTFFPISYIDSNFSQDSTISVTNLIRWIKEYFPEQKIDFSNTREITQSQEDKKPSNRPNQTKYIRQEYERRRDAKKLMGDWRKECDSLFEWYNSTNNKGLSDHKTIRTRVIQQKEYLLAFQQQK